MGIGSLISWMICGLIVGLIARLLVPGRQKMGFVMTMLTGIAGALVGGFLYSMFQGPAARPFAMDQDNWYGWTVSILGAMLLVWLCPKVFSRT